MPRYEVYIGDCRDILPKIKEKYGRNFIQLTVTSPPYAWEFRYREKELQLGEIWDIKEFFNELTRIWKMVYDITCAGGYIAVVFGEICDAYKVFGHYRVQSLVGGMVESVEKAGFYLISEWIWRKYDAGASVVIRPYRAYKQMVSGNYIPASGFNFEYVFVWRKPSKHSLPIFDVKESEWFPTYLDGIWDIPYGKEDKDPACFPIELARRLIKIYSRKNHIVLDPFLGSGTTMRACRELERSCIGIEVDKSRLNRIKEKVGWNSSLVGDEFYEFY